MLLFSSEPSSLPDSSNNKVFIITHKPAPPSLTNLQTFSWMQVLLCTTSNDSSDITGQSVGRTYNTRLILTHAELVGNDPHTVPPD